MMRRLWLIAMSIALLLATAPAQAQSTAERKAARALGDEALKLYEQGEWAAAHDRFQQANQLLQAPTLELYMARCQVQLGKLAAAYEQLSRVANTPLALDAPKQFIKAQQTARGELADLETRVPSLLVMVEGPAAEEVSLIIDGGPPQEPSPEHELRLDPGEHSIEASAPGFEPTSATIELNEGDEETLQLLLRAAKQGQGSAIDVAALWPAFVAYGVGAVGLGIGIVTGAMASSKADDVKSRCVDDHCLVEDKALGDEAETLASVSTVGFILAGVGAATGFALTIWPLGDDAGGGEPSAAVKLGPGYAGIVGTF